MAAVGTAAAQPGVSVVSMSWGFPEGQDVFAADEAAYDSTFQVPGVTFVASTGDYGAADPEYPAFSPYVVSVGGTSLSLNADNSYQSETGWGYNSSAAGMFIGSGGGISLYEPEPAYQAGVQSTGSRTTPDVSLVADPATGAWIADPYNLDPSDPFEIVGGTSLSAPAWAGLLALANQGRVAAGQSTLNSASPTEAQQALYSLPQNDYNVIASGTNGYTAHAGYNLVTGLGTPVANHLVSDLVAYAGPGTTYQGPKVAPLQDATRTDTGANNGGPINELNVFDSFTVTQRRARRHPDSRCRRRPRRCATAGRATSLSVVSAIGTARTLSPGASSVAMPVASTPWFESVSFPAATLAPLSSSTLATAAAPSVRPGAVLSGAPTSWASLIPPLSHSRGLKANSVARDQAPVWVIGADSDDPYQELRIVPIETSPVSPRSVLTLWDDALTAWVTESDQPAGSPVVEKASNPAGSVEGLAASALESMMAAGGAVRSLGLLGDTIPSWRSAPSPASLAKG